MNGLLDTTAEPSTNTYISKNEQTFIEEYKQFLTEFLFPLLGNNSVTLEEVSFTETHRRFVVEQKEDMVYF